MQKAKIFIEELLKEYSKLEVNQPKLYSPKISEDIQDAYHLKLEDGALRLTARNSLAAAYGLNRLLMGCKSRHWAESLGGISPKYSLRPLWLKCEISFRIGANLGIGIPRFMVNPDFSIVAEHVCKRIIALGYNAIIIGGSEKCVDQKDCDNLKIIQLIKIFHEYGLKVILKPALILKDVTACPINIIYKNILQASILEAFTAFPEIDYFMWESNSNHPTFMADLEAAYFTHIELVKNELHLLEKIVPSHIPLIYFLPTADVYNTKNYSKWFLELCGGTAPTTTLAFLSTEKDPKKPHFNLHPIWDALRAIPHNLQTKLLPIVYLGENKENGNSSPLLLDSLTQTFSNFYRHQFAGMAGIVTEIPAEGTISDCNLWVAGQALWQDIPIHKLAETWFMAKHPGLNFSEKMSSIEAIKNIATNLDYLLRLKSDKESIEGLLTQLIQIVKEIKQIVA